MSHNPMRGSQHDGVPPGGSIERTLAGEAELGIAAAVKEAWHASAGLRGTVAPGMLLVAGALVLVLLVLGNLFDLTEPTPLGETVTQLTTMMIVYPYMAGAFLVSLRHLGGQRVAFGDQFACYASMLPIVAVGLLQSLVTSLGLMLLIVPGIYLSFALYLAVPLKAERDLPMTECLLTSIKLVNRKLFEVSVLSLLSGVLVVAGVFSIVGWIWTWPWALMILAVVYRQLAGFGATQRSVEMEF
ncbi:MAG: hypothetical protein ACODAC_10515 [Pseudomonadota bacterium]